MKLFLLAILCVSAFVGSSCRSPPYGGAGFYPGPTYYPQTPPEIRCPNVNCVENPPELQKECKDDMDCVQREKCCNYPCDEGKKYCMQNSKDFYSSEVRVNECLLIKNCKKWKEENKSNQFCEDNGDCNRNEKCCHIPCNGKKMCQKTVEVILNSGLRSYAPLPPPTPVSMPVAAGRPI